MPVQLVRNLTITLLASFALGACAPLEPTDKPLTDSVFNEPANLVRVEIGIDEKGCAIAPQDIEVKAGNKLVISLKNDANRSKVAAWSIGFTEGTVNKFGCTLLNPGTPTAVNIRSVDKQRVCYTIVTKLAAPVGNLGYCELDPTIFVNRDAQGVILTSCANSSPSLIATPPRLTCGRALEPGDWSAES